MGIPIVAIRVRVRGDNMEITTLGSSPRGTRFRLKTVQVDGVKGPKAAFHGKVEAAVDSLLPAVPGLPE